MIDKNYNLIINRQRGFTMVEMLTTVAIFSILALIVSSVLIKALEIERRSFSTQVIQESALATLETMAKEIRVSRIENQNNNCSTDPLLSQLNIVHPTEGAITYRLNVSGIVERVVGSSTYFLSYSEVIFNSLRFCVIGSTTPADDKPSRVTIVSSISNRTGIDILTINLQTGVTSRYTANEF